MNLLASALCCSHDDSPFLAHPRKDRSIAAGRTGPKDQFSDARERAPNAQQASLGSLRGWFETRRTLG